MVHADTKINALLNSLNMQNPPEPGMGFTRSGLGNHDQFAPPPCKPTTCRESRCATTLHDAPTECCRYLCLSNPYGNGCERWSRCRMFPSGSVKKTTFTPLLSLGSVRKLTPFSFRPA